MKLGMFAKTRLLLAAIFITASFVQVGGAQEIITQDSLNGNSIIEMTFGNGLKQVGYNIFQNISSSKSGRYGSNYKLNAGDKVQAYLWGDSIDILSLTGKSTLNPIIGTEVDTGGNIFISGIGLVKAENRTISQVEADVQGLLKQKYSSAKVKLTLADSTELPVYVYGYVDKPGKVDIVPNATILEAIAAAGGINKNGTLRNIVVKSNNQNINVDLYDIVLKGKNINIKFHPGDSIFVKPIGNVVCLTNGVKVPGIYEFKSGEKVDSLVSYAGEYLPDTDKRIINIKSLNAASGQRLSKDIPILGLEKTNLQNGDIIQFKSLYSQAENYVRLEGNVKHPGIFQYKSGMKVSDILPNKNELLNETLIYQAVIKRVTGTDKQIKYVPVSLEDLFNGGVDPKLSQGDDLIVFRSMNVNSIDVFGCIDEPKFIPYKDTLTLKDIIANVKFISSSDKKSSPASKDQQGSAANANITHIQKIGTQNNNIVYNPSEIAVEITNTSEQEPRIYYLYDILIKNDTTATININKNDKVLFRPLRDTEIIKTVKVSGFVNNPGVYKFIKGTKLNEMLEMAGGLNDDANLRGIVFRRPSLATGQSQIMNAINQRDKQELEGQMANATVTNQETIDYQKLMLQSIQNEDYIKKLNGRIALEITNNSIKNIDESNNIIIQDGDEIYIPRQCNHVTLIGEVQNEASFVYVNGKNAEYYIKYGGGLTSYAKKSGIYKIGVNGKAYKIGYFAKESISPGDTIVVPRKINSHMMEAVKSSIQLGMNALNAIFIITKL